MPCDLGILFVHGIGDQRKGATLVDFGTPLFEWVKAHATQEGTTVTVSKAVLPTEGRVPANAEWVFTKGQQTRTWRVAEAWWAESFAMRPFRELARWSYSILPWTFGAHFGRRLWRALRAPKVGPWNLVKWCAGVAAAFLALLGGLALSLLLFVAFSGLLTVSLIPWQRLRTGIQRIQIRLASTIGDCFVLVNRPMESAAIVTRFHRELGWLLKDCNRVAVVAHSQGGAVAAQALGDQLPEKVKLLITFGSGLRKLHDLTDLRASGSLRRGALLTALALLPVTCGLLFLAALVARNDPRSLDLGGTAAVLGWAAVGLAVLSGGINDFIRIPDSQNLRDLAKRFKDGNVRWDDIFASADPVPNGRLHEDRTILPTSTEIINFGSALRDHTTYWSNSDGFVSRVASALLSYDSPPILAPLSEDTLSYLAQWRARRVRIGRAGGWIGLLSLLAIGVRYANDWSSVLGFGLTSATNKLAKLFGGEACVSAAPTAVQWGRSLGWLSGVLILWAATKAIWNANDRREKSPPYRPDVESDIRTIVAMVFQLVLVGIAWNYGKMVPTWIFMICLFSPMLFFFQWNKCPPPSQLVDAVALVPSPPATQVEKKTQAERRFQFLYNLFQAGISIFGMYLVVRLSLKWSRKLLERLFGIANPSWTLSLGAALLCLVVLVLTLGGVLTLARRRRTPKSVPSAADSGTPK